MLIGKNKRRISHNLIISKFFEEENSEIQNQYFLRNVADELSVVALGFGGFFVFINPCSFDIEYDSDTFKNLLDINLKEVEKFEACAATVFRLYDQPQVPEFNFEHILSELETEEMRREFNTVVEEITGINDQYANATDVLGSSFDSIELNIDALNNANYKHIDEEGETTEMNPVETDVDDIERVLEERKRELEEINRQLEVKEQRLVEKIESNMDEVTRLEQDLMDFEQELNQLDDVFTPDDLFADMGLELTEESDKNTEEDEEEK